MSALQLTTLCVLDDGISISSNEKCKLNGSLREFKPEDVNAYMCIVQHSWSNSRQYFISSGGHNGGVGLLLHIILTICFIVCCYEREKTNGPEKAYSATQIFITVKSYEWITTQSMF